MSFKYLKFRFRNYRYTKAQSQIQEENAKVVVLPWSMRCLKNEFLNPDITYRCCWILAINCFVNSLYFIVVRPISDLLMNVASQRNSIARRQFQAANTMRRSNCNFRLAIATCHYRQNCNSSSFSSSSSSSPARKETMPGMQFALPSAITTLAPKCRQNCTLQRPPLVVTYIYWCYFSLDTTRYWDSVLDFVLLIRDRRLATVWWRRRQLPYCMHQSWVIGKPWRSAPNHSGSKAVKIQQNQCCFVV